MDDIIGHDKILEFFAKVIKNDSLNHAYCLVGPESVGKRTVAEYISAKLLNVERQTLKKIPDVTVVEQIINEKTGKLRKDISIEQIRGLITTLYQRPFINGGYRVAIIDRAELMSRGACNALLKTLEEPKEKTILFLTTTDETRLLPTVQSRCQMIYFSPVPAELIKDFLEARGIKPQQIEEMVKISGGLPGRIITWCKDEDVYKIYKREIERFGSLRGKNFFEKLKIVEELFGDKTDHIMARENLQHVLDIWQLQLHTQIESGGMADNVVGVDKDIKKAKQLLAQNVHPRLLIEHILLQIP